jgi:hypothetical protein
VRPRFAYALAIALAATAAGAAAPAGGARRVPHCRARGVTLLQTPKVRVFRRSDGRAYGCWRRTGRVTYLIREGPIEEGSAEVSIASRLVNGAHARVAHGGPFIALVRDTESELGSVYDELFVVDLRAGRVVHHVRPLAVSYEVRIGSFVLGADGSAGFVSERFGGGGPCPKEPKHWGAAVEAIDHSGHRTLDCGLLEREAGEGGEFTGNPPGSGISTLRLAGRAASWLHAGETRTASLE